MKVVTHALCWIASRSDSQTTHAIIFTDSRSLLQKVKSGMGSPDWNVSMVDIRLRKLPWVYCPGHAGVEGNDGAERLAVEKKKSITDGLRLGRSEVWQDLHLGLRIMSLTATVLGENTCRQGLKLFVKRSEFNSCWRMALYKNYYYYYYYYYCCCCCCCCYI